MLALRIARNLSRSAPAAVNAGVSRAFASSRIAANEAGAGEGDPVKDVFTRVQRDFLALIERALAACDSSERWSFEVTVGGGRSSISARSDNSTGGRFRSIASAYAAHSSIIHFLRACQTAAARSPPCTF